MEDTYFDLQPRQQPMVEGHWNSEAKQAMRQQDVITKVIVGIVIFVFVCIIVYFICLSFQPKPHVLYSGGLMVGSIDEQPQEEANSLRPSEGFIHRRLVSAANSESNRPNEGTRIDYKAVNDSLASVCDASDGKLFCGLDKKASDSKTYYMDKINGTRWKRGICRQQQNKQREYNGQTSVEGVSIGNNRVNYNGLSALGTIKGSVPECDGVSDNAKRVNSLPASKKGTEMFKHLNNATIDDRGYANPEAFTPTNDGGGLLSNARLAGGAMNLNGLNGTMWKKYKPVDATSPFPAQMNIMEGRPAPFNFVSNPNW